MSPYDNVAQKVLNEDDNKVFPNPAKVVLVHSSEIRGLRSTKCSSETLQSLLYFMSKKTHVVLFRFSFHATLFFFTL